MVQKYAGRAKEKMYKACQKYWAECRQSSHCKFITSEHVCSLRGCQSKDMYPTGWNCQFINFFKPFCHLVGLWRHVVLRVGRVNVQDQLVDVLLPVLLQTNVVALSHKVGVVSSGEVVVAALEESQASAGDVTPLVLGHVLLVVVVGAVAAKEVARVLGAVEEDSKEQGGAETAEEVDNFHIVVIATGADDHLRHGGAVGGVAGLSGERHAEAIARRREEHLVSVSVSST